MESVAEMIYKVSLCLRGHTMFRRRTFVDFGIVFSANRGEAIIRVLEDLAIVAKKSHRDEVILSDLENELTAIQGVTPESLLGTNVEQWNSWISIIFGIFQAHRVISNTL